MSDAEASQSVGRDALGILLFGLAAFAGISVVMSMLEPARAPSGTTAIVTALVGAIGAVPALALCAGLAWLGARLWLSGIRSGTARELAGLAAVALAASVLAGAFAERAGGTLGAVSGAAVARQMSRFVAVPFGLVAVLVPVWFFWLRPRLRFSEIPGEGEPTPAAAPTESEGVSAEEAAALLPEPAQRPAERKLQKASALRQALETAAAQRSSPSTTPPPPLYPADVRLQGGIPEGARPLDPIHEPSPKPGAARPPTVQRQPPEGFAGSGQRPGQDLAPAPSRATWASPPAERTHSADVGDDAARPVDPASSAEDLRRSAGLEPIPTFVPPADRDAEPLLASASPVQAELTPPTGEVPIVEGTPASPSWEEGDLFEEPVDAYGTPLALVEVLRRANAESAELLVESRPRSPVEVQPVAVEEDDLDTEERQEEDDELEETGSQIDDVEEDDDEGEAEDEELGEGDDLELEELDDEEPLTSELEGELDEAASEEERGAGIEQDADEAEAAGEARDAEDPERGPAVPVLEKGSLSGPSLPAPAPDVEVLQAGLVSQGASNPSVGLAQTELFATDSARAPSLAANEPEEEPELAMAEVELAPLAAPRPQSELPSSEDLVFRAGALILERKRVAVSMLQREFGLDFKAATDVLDQLQKAGLIGPYLGGQRRDILLTPEQWRERVGAV